MSPSPPRSEELMAYAMDAWADTVYRIALFHARSVPDAEDITQDVFVRLLKSTLAFEDDDHLKAWLISVTLNRCRETHRTTQLTASPVASFPTRAPRRRPTRPFPRSARFGTFGSLPPNMRSAMPALCGRLFGEDSEHGSMPPSTVR
ncbi:MAG: RNA polymerase sigma factor [Slackia sp.]